MGIKEKYQINNETWNKLKKNYNVLLLSGTPFMTIVFASIVWTITDKILWMLVPIIPWLFLYIIVLSMYTFFIKRSKYTVLFIFLYLALFTYFFSVIASACVFRLFGSIGLIIQSILLIIAGIFFCMYYYKYFSRVWESHKYHNEEIALDQENARYDFLNNFNMDESEIIKKTGKGYLNPFLINLIFSVAPVSVAGGLILSRNGMDLLVIIVTWVLSVPVSLGFIKPVMGGFYNYRKLTYFEKKLGKPIINGLLDS